jgi:UDP-3-O-[3-hydroxymyristoyl] glucosamine N-acyltransferase
MIHPSAIIDPQATIGQDCEIGAYVVIEGPVLIGRNTTIFAGAYIGKPPRAAGVVANQPVAMRTTHIGAGSVIGSHAVIYAGARLEGRNLVGDGTAIREDTDVGEDTVIGSNCTVQNGARIGRRVKIVDLSHITFDCVIGDECFISVGVYTMNDNSMQRGGEVIGPKIGRRVRIGGGAMLLPGVEIGDDAVIAAGAVVTKNVSSEETVMGIPAKTKVQRLTPIPEHDWPTFERWPYEKWPPQE